jgi:RNA polymerase sigma-70 factor, ECF subfamily
LQRSDKDLVTRCLAGDGAAFEALLDAHGGRVKAYFLRSGFGPADAEDLAQDVFVRIYKSLATFDAEKGTFGGWAATIARNVARKRWEKRALPDSFDPELAEEMFASWENPGVPIELQEELDALSLCIEALPLELARVIHLRYVQGRTTRGIATEMAVSEFTVRTRLKEAGVMLEQCLRAKGVYE